MIEPLYIITNNPLSDEHFKNNFEVIYLENGNAMDVLRKVRDEIHIGHKLLTHPLMSSVKPNETPYRTICVSIEKNKSIDLQSLDIIENSIHTTEKFLKDFNTPKWSDKILKDFQLIDCDLIHHAIE
ncbi:GrdX family protein [Clostridium ihumii]|uniref:GrdX family protein n=1 Tax=Clostridium ihumii TaxID=1470356 RepID=UPI000A58B763|nr:GrdX family protein [Clostridium ihumii]